MVWPRAASFASFGGLGLWSLHQRSKAGTEYYCTSSIALALDGYTNTAALQEEGTPNLPLPTNIDVKMVDCESDDRARDAFG